MTGLNTNAAIALDALVRGAGPIIDPPLVKSWYAPYRAGQPTEGVEVRSGLAYGADERHRLDVYLPEQPSSSQRPVLIFMHGGGFVRGDRGDRANVGWFFARAGFVTVLPGYRLGPAHRWPAGAEDLAAAWAWVHANADSLNADAARIFIAGESAGAAHVATATLIDRFRHPEVHAPAAAILISGVYNPQLEWLARHQFNIQTPDPRNEAYFGTDFSLYPSMSSVDHVDAKPFPTLITYAELDPPQMQVQAGELFARLVTQHGFTPDLKVIRRHNHLSQLEAINTVDDVMTSILMEFLDGL
jgi:acetyl esterase